MALGRDSILKHAGSQSVGTVHVPKWVDESGDDTVLVRGMSIREYELNSARAADGKSTAALLARCIVDESGGRLFTDKDVDQIAELGLGEVNRLADEIAELSGMNKDDAAAVDKEIDTAGKADSPETGSSDSGSPVT